MKKTRKYLFSIVYLTILFLMLLLFFEINNENIYFCEQVINANKKNQLEGVIFGDSVLGAGGIRDKQKLSIQSIIEKISKYSILSMADSGHSPIIYENTVKIFHLLNFKPKFIILEINLRSFSQSWLSTPDYWFKSEISKLYLQYGRFSFDHLWTYLYYTKLNGLQKDRKHYNKNIINIPNVFLGERQMLNIKKSITTDIPLEYLTNINGYQQQLNLSFHDHYAFTLSEINANFIALKHLLDDIKQLKIPLVIFITPINIYEGEQYVPKIRSYLTQQKTMIINLCKENEYNPLDYSFDLDSSFFVQKNHVCEHLNYEGKLYLAQKITVELNNIYKK